MLGECSRLKTGTLDKENLWQADLSAHYVVALYVAEHDHKPQPSRILPVRGLLCTVNGVFVEDERATLPTLHTC